MKNIVSLGRMAALAICAVILSACGGGGDAASATASADSVGGNMLQTQAVTAAQSYTLSGSLSGLSVGPGHSVTLLVNSGSPQTLSSNGAFTFNGKVAANGAYTVTVAIQPWGQVCTVANATATGVNANVSNIQINCSSKSLTVGGTVAGLANGGQLVLLNNGDNPTRITSNGRFAFSKPIAYGSNFGVTVLQQPDGQHCTVNSGTGAGVLTNVSNVAVSCSLDTYTISYTVYGLAAGHQFTLLNNGADPQIVKANGTGRFDVPVAYGSGYAITVNPQPVGQLCTVVNGYNNRIEENVSNVGVMCATTTYTIGGTVSGLNAGEQVTLFDNAANPITVTANGAFTFPVRAAAGGSYAVTVGTQPLGQTCTVANGTGSVVGSNITNIQVACALPDMTVLHTFSGPDGAFVASGATWGADGNLYGTTMQGGATGNGTIYSYNPVSGKFATLHSFDMPNDGGQVSSGLTLGRDGNLYGTAPQGGAYYGGTLYMFNPRTAKVTVLYAFNSNAEGNNPNPGVVQGRDGNWYGALSAGGPNGQGSVYMYSPATGKVTLLYAFKGADGSIPLANLIQGRDGNLYGTTSQGGANGVGTVFSFNLSSNKFTLMHSFNDTDGRYPYAPLIQGQDGNLYGSTWLGGTYGSGTLFSINLTSAKFSMVHAFNGGDGGAVWGGLLQGRDGNFYGTTTDGGQTGTGTIFVFAPATGKLTVLYSFNSSIGGTNPEAALTLGADGFLYGTTQNGGAGNSGTLFKF